MSSTYTQKRNTFIKELVDSYQEFPVQIHLVHYETEELVRFYFQKNDNSQSFQILVTHNKDSDFYCVSTGRLNIFLDPDVSSDTDIKKLIINFTKHIAAKTANMDDITLYHIFRVRSNGHLNLLSRLASLEVKAMLANKKAVQKNDILTSELPEVEKLYTKFGIHLIVVKEKFIFEKGLQSEIQYGSASRSYYFASLNKACILKCSRIEKSKYIGIKRKIKIIGKELGYPKCCAKNLAENHPLNTPDLYFLINQRTKTKPDFRANIVDKMNRIVSYVPCSFDCRKTIELVNELQHTLSIVDMDFLKTFIIYFRDGCYIKTKIKKSGDYLYYTILNISEGEFKGSLEDPVKKEMIKIIQSGDYFILNPGLQVGKNEKILHHFLIDETIFTIMDFT